MKKLMTLALGLSFLMGTVSLFAQDKPAAPPAAAMDKKVISKACSDQADAKGLHGKERKKFRSECKHHGGKA